MDVLKKYLTIRFACKTNKMDPSVYVVMEL